jgi:DNA polymerase-4
MKPDERKIIHIDMDAFYASVEQRDRPELRGKPLAVGGSGGRGVIAAASYEARKFGVRSAMPAKTALRKCPMLLFVKSDFEKYKQVSAEIRKIFERYTSVIEPLSLDEAFLDVTYTNFEVSSATLIAQQIKNDIQNELNLVASAGVSYNKFLAKIASDQDKPNGLFVISPEQGPEFIEALAIEKFFGVGKVTAEKMKKHGINFGRDLLKYNKSELQQLFGKSGGFLYYISRGIDNREIQSKRKRKSVGAENTFSENIHGEIAVNEKFSAIFEKWWGRYTHHGKWGRTITVKVRNSDFDTVTRSYTSEEWLKDKNDIRKIAFELLDEAEAQQQHLRLMGISISGLMDEDGNEEIKQLSLW